jgi:membrane-bound lytic murein transglycosylase A
MPARLFILLLILSASACSNQPPKPPAKEPAPPAPAAITPVVKPACNCPPPPAPVELPPIQIPDAQKYAPPTAKSDEPIKGPDYSLLKPATWEELEGIEQDNLSAAWPAWLQSCTTLKKKQPWQAACDAAAVMANPSSEAIQTYLKQYFNVYRATNTDGTDIGLITGYYEPLLKGSRVKSERYRYPLYAQPDDLISVELGSVYPELANKRVRGRLIDNKLVPYYNRGEIDLAQSPLQGKELLWIDDIIDLFFLQIQGSGLIQLDNGERLHVGYADQNGQAYQSIGRLLIDRGELSADKASMQGIKAWARLNPDKLRDLLNSNPSYVFFRELPAGLPGPIGALGVPILAERSVAIDPFYIPLGAPVLLSTTYPNSSKPLQRLMLAQDTGGAIKGGVRADFFWGAGLEAGRQAGAMKQRGKIWVLLPRNFPLTASN